MLAAALGPARRLTAVRSWAVWELHGWLRRYVIGVIVIYGVAIAIAAGWSQLKLRDVQVFGVFLAFCVAVIELTRRSGEPAGVRTDLHGVWCLPVALLLPPLYALVCAIPVEILTQLRVRSALAYRRVFTAAAVGLSYGAASAAFHAVARPASASVTGTTAQALCWLGLAACCGCLQVLINKALVITAVKGAEPETPWRRLLGDGEALYNDLAGLCLAVVVAVPTARVTAAIGFALPLTVLVQRSQRHAELAGQARIDGKTGLLNARTWQREAHIEITRAVRRATPLAVAMVDIDRFKHINDTYGHLAGDTVLATLAATVRSVLRDTDIAGRFGGEEFALLLPAATREQARQITGHLCTRLAQIITPVISAAGKWQLKVTVSIGVATLHSSRRDLTDLLAAADLALYQAKERGRDQVCIFGE